MSGAQTARRPNGPPQGYTDPLSPPFPPPKNGPIFIKDAQCAETKCFNRPKNKNKCLKRCAMF